MFTADGQLKFSNPVSPPQNFNLYGVGKEPDISEGTIQTMQKWHSSLIESDSNGLNCIAPLKIGSTFHKKIRQHLRPFLKPGIKLSEISQIIENKCMELTREQGTNYGIGFPPSLSLDNCAAHFNPSLKHDRIVNEDSVLKIDFGVNVCEWITDCAFTIVFNEKYKSLLDAVKEATYHGVKTIAYDGVVSDWGSEIHEILSSYEYEGEPIKPIKNLGGHNIINGHIHGGEFLPSWKFNRGWNTHRFKENLYAVEVFGSTKSDRVEEKEEENTIYMSKLDEKTSLSARNIIPNNYLKVYDVTYSNFKRMPLCQKYIEKYSIFSEWKNDSKFIGKAFDYFNSKEIIKKYPPLYCIKGGMTAQYEHDIYVSDGKKIIFTQDTDY